MTFNPNKPCQTRDGRDVRIFDTNGRYGRNGQFPILARVTNKVGNITSALYYDKDGVAAYYNADSPNALVNIPERTTKWRNVWDKPGANTYEYATREEAEDKPETFAKRIGLLELHYEDDVCVSATFHKVS